MRAMRGFRGRFILSCTCVCHPYRHWILTLGALRSNDGTTATYEFHPQGKFYGLPHLDDRRHVHGLNQLITCDSIDQLCVNQTQPLGPPAGKHLPE